MFGLVFGDDAIILPQNYEMEVNYGYGKYIYEF